MIGPKRQMAADPFQNCLNYAYKLLSYRARSVRELETRLGQKGHSRSTIRKVVDHLKDLDYLDDSEFARAWVEERMKIKPMGRSGLRYELRSKGIDDALIEATIGQLIRPEDEYRLARELAEKRLQGQQGQPALNKRKKSTHDYLARRGFPYEVISSVLREISGKDW